MTAQEKRERERALARVWAKHVIGDVRYGITVIAPHLTLTKRLDELRVALEAAYEAGARNTRTGTAR